ncbi:hypothetical protein [Bacillus sp. S14(2024)]|uniref:hypothetical protein n=1 Tax=Bacillus sp. S14(2024) TaxID=3162884 RepID=UPI003D1B314C
MKVMNSYKLVSFNVVVVTTYKRYHIVTIKLTNLYYLKTNELKALVSYGQQVLFILRLQHRVRVTLVRLLMM